MDELLKQIKIVSSFLVDAEPLELIPRVDGIFVFGCSDGRVALQATRAFRQAKAPYIAVSGEGKAEKLPTGFNTEADYFCFLLRERGIPKSAIIFDPNAANTLENVVYGIASIQKHFPTPRSLIVCAKPHHLRRARATFARQFPNIITYGSAYEVADRELVDNPRMLYKILREIEKLQFYAKKGDIAHIEIPLHIMDAYENAKKLYTKLF